jgi:GAF domain-containing protein
MATEAFDRAAAALATQTTIRGLLDAGCREAVGLLDATACAISRVIGDLLVGLAEHTTSGRPLAYGHEYLISDFPLTREVVDSGEARWVWRHDTAADESEAALLTKLGFESVLMVCLPSSDSCWGLVEVYNEQGSFDEQQAGLAERLAQELGVQLERLEPPESR